jgi:hypothetical protein
VLAFPTSNVRLAQNIGWQSLKFLRKDDSPGRVMGRHNTSWQTDVLSLLICSTLPKKSSKYEEWDGVGLTAVGRLEEALEIE